MNDVLLNGFLFLLPILLLNGAFYSKLPKEYSSSTFDEGIPSFILWGENLFRVFVFFIPLLFQVSFKTQSGLWGGGIFMIGLFLYFLSWGMLLSNRDMGWRKHVFLFTAPAYTPLIWITGLSMMGESYYFFTPYQPWHYWVPGAMFISFHLRHSYLAFYKMNEKESG